MRYDSKDFQGLVPALDARKSDQLFAIGGRNFVLDSYGPKSNFGNRLVTPFALGSPAHVQGCRLRLRSGVRTFTFTGDAIIEWSESAGTFNVIYVTGVTNASPARWTWGYLNGIMYFCHPSIGILGYVINTGVCLPITSPGIPQAPIALRVAQGRVGVLDEDYLSWSAPGDGLNWNPTVGGAGQFKQSARISGQPIMLNSYGKGFLVWTTAGLLRAEFTGDSQVFRLREVNTEFQPINSFCTLQMDDNTVAVLDERGFYQTTGDIPQPMVPLFNEFLIDYLQRNKLRLGQNVRVEWDDRKRFLYLSLSLSQSDPIYERAFVLYPSLDKWGTFDEAHYGILPVHINDSTRQDDYFGFVDSAGRLRYWIPVGSRETYPTSGNLNAVRKLAQKPPHNDSGAIVLSSSRALNTVNSILYTQREGFYGASGYSPAASQLTGLDSIVQLGYVRAKAEGEPDHMIEISTLFVGSAQSGDPDQTAVDFNVIPNDDEESWDQLTDVEDFGINESTFTNHQLRIIGTLDGVTKFSEEVPTLVRFNKAGRNFSCSCVGLWNIIELKAQEIGEAYHLRVLELRVVDAGVID